MDKGDFSEDAEDSLREPVDLSEVVSALEDFDVFFEKSPMIAASGTRVRPQTIAIGSLLSPEKSLRKMLQNCPGEGGTVEEK